MMMFCDKARPWVYNAGGFIILNYKVTTKKHIHNGG